MPWVGMFPSASFAPAVPGSPKEPPIIDGPPGEGEEGLQKLLFVANYAGAVDAAIEVSC